MASKLRTLIVDDEPVARDLLVRMLARDERVEVVGECADGDSALRTIRALCPELVLLDVSMPGKNGLEVVEALGDGRRPAIVFVTAHGDFAVRAFGVHAVDYLLKPVQEERLATALERVLNAREPEAWRRLQSRLDRLLAARKQGADEEEWLVVRQGDKRVPLRWEEIVWIESAGNYARVHGAGGEFLLRASLNELEERMGALPFARIHRQTLVNVSRIVSMRPVGHGDFRIQVAGGRELPLSRRYRPELERILGRLS